MSLLVEVEDLTKAYDDGPAALAGISFAVEPGHIFGFLGPNGAGKTTAIRILVTLLGPSSGWARVGGYDVARNPHQVRRLIGYAGQFIALDKDLTARENIVLQARLQGMTLADARRRAADMLASSSLSDHADRRTATLSGGMRRRLELAQALVHRPPLVFLDEPTTGLDPQSRSDLWRSLQDLRSTGGTIFLTTQYLEEADRLCDDLAIIDHGRIVVTGSPAKLKQDGGHDIVSVSVDDDAPEHLSRASRALARLPGVAMPTVSDRSVSVTVPHAAEQLSEIVRLLDAEGVRIRSLAVAEPTLDDVFLAHTGGRFNSDGNAPMLVASDPKATAK